jgi:hypothetical protein
MMDNQQQHVPPGMHYAAPPIKAVTAKKDVRDNAYDARLVPLPGTKVRLAPFGVKEPHQIIKAAVVASQIAEELLISRRRIYSIVEWRTATYYVLLDLMPKVSRSRACKIMQRDRSTLVHFAKKRVADPSFLADKVSAIKRVLV